MNSNQRAVEKNTSDELMLQLESYAQDSADQIRSNVEKMDMEVYANFLNIMYHYTKGSEEKLKKAASVAHIKELKDYFLQMAKEERGHYILAQEDLKELGQEVSPYECKEVKEFGDNWNKLAEKGVYGYMGAVYVFENVAKHLQKEGKELLSRLNLKKTQSRWIAVHLEADLEHGDEISKICAKYGDEAPEAILHGAEIMHKAWVNVFIAATRLSA